MSKIKLRKQIQSATTVDSDYYKKPQGTSSLSKYIIMPDGSYRNNDIELARAILNRKKMEKR